MTDHPRFNHEYPIEQWWDRNLPRVLLALGIAIGILIWALI